MLKPSVKYLWRSDLYRCTNGGSGLSAAFNAYRKDPGFCILFWIRLAKHTRRSLFWLPVHLFARLVHKRLKYKYGISLPWDTELGSGFYIGHFGGIVVNAAAVIGNNCNIAHGVTIGQVNRGPKKGVPVIGNNVWIGAGAVVIGAINIGDNALIGPNAVVTSDIPRNAVAVGIPAKVVSFAGTESYVEYTDY